MDRRTFVLLTGATTAALWRPPRLLTRGSPLAGTLRFDLDDQRRIDLWYNAPNRSLPLLRNAALGVWIGDTLVTLADLEDVSVGNRRPPRGESLVIRGRTLGSWVEAEFVAWDANVAADAGAHGAITITVYPDRVLATIRGMRFFATSEPQVLPTDTGNAAALIALINGYQSWNSCRVTPLPADATSYGAIALSRGGHSLGVIWDPGEAGDAKVRLTTAGGIEAVSEWAPARPVRPDGDSATLHIAYVAAGDGLDALTAAATPLSEVDRERVAGLVVPTGWCSWYELGGAVTEADMLANIDFCAAHFDRRFLRYIQLDDGYQRAAGDWEMNDKFPGGHRSLTDRIHAAGFQAGLWIAPFAAAERTPVAANSAWLIKGADGTPLTVDTREQWGGRIFPLDGAHPDVQQWLYALARRAVSEWGYDYLKVDFLEWSTAGEGATHYGGLTRAEAYRRGLSALRGGLGTEAFLLGCGAPLQHAAGLVDGMRIGADVEASWPGIQAPARAAALRSFYHRSLWLNDPDCLVVRPPLTLDEARVWASVVALSGGMVMLSDNLPKLPVERLPILQKALPVARTTRPPRIIGAQVEEHQAAAAPVAGDSMAHDTGGAGAAGSTQSGAHDRPAGAWIVEGAQHWWTLTLVNWDDEPRDITQPLAVLGIVATKGSRSTRFSAYDVWAQQPMAAVQQTLTATIPPHSTLTMALRQAATHPQIVGTTRHVIQGAVDIGEERWDAATRTLHGKAVNLDGRAYAITIAVPRSLLPKGCKADVACTVERRESGHAVISWPEGTTNDVAWSLSFGARPR
ncbi:MAG TPA: alpha-galactosidase [Gemmatimonadales bacterium]|nr:alpha-galactosidase [Gemmatimonadales bacterium]